MVACDTSKEEYDWTGPRSRYAVRRLRKSPGFAFFVITVMALGIGATTAMFSVIRAILLEPLPYRDPDRGCTALQIGHSHQI